MNESQRLVTLVTPEIDVIKNAETRQVLVNFGLGRKKVFSVDGLASLAVQFTNYVQADPAFKKILSKSYIVFQEYSAKFGTWVDIDAKTTLSDGAVVNAVFSPRIIETDVKNPDFIERKRFTEEIKIFPDVKHSKILCEAKDNRPLCSSVNSGSSSSVSASNQCLSVGAVPVSAGENVSYKKTPVTNDFQTVAQCNKDIMASKREQNSGKQHKSLVNDLNKQESNLIHSLPSINVKTNHTFLEQYENVAAPLNIDSTPSVARNFINDQQVNTNISCCIKQEDDFDRTGKESGAEAIFHSNETETTNLDIKRGSHSLEEKHVNLAKDQFKHGIQEKRKAWGREILSQRNDWKEYIFSGATQFYIRNKRIKHVSTMDAHRTNLKLQMFWGCVDFQGTITISVVNASSCKKEMCRMLANQVLPYLKKNFPRRNKLMHSDHLSSIYRKSNVKCLLEAYSIEPVVWPSYVWDANPLEHVWNLIEEKVQNVECSKMEEIFVVINNVWTNDLDLQSLCNDFVLSMQGIINKMVTQPGKAIQI